MKCTVIKLSETVNDDSLPIIGALQFLFDGNANGAVFVIGVNGSLNIKCSGGLISSNNVDFLSELIISNQSLKTETIRVKTENNQPANLTITGDGIFNLGNNTGDAFFGVTNYSQADNSMVKITGLDGFPIGDFHNQLSTHGVAGYMYFNLNSLKFSKKNNYNVVVNTGILEKRIYGEITDSFVEGFIPVTFQIYSQNSLMSTNPQYKITLDISRYSDFIGNRGVSLSVRGSEATGDIGVLKPSNRSISSFSIGARNSNKYIQCSKIFEHIVSFTGTNTPIRILQPMTPEHVDNFIIGISKATFPVETSTLLEIRGARTSSSDSAVQDLINKGVTVSLLAI